VAEFTDARKTDDPLVIGHVIEKNGTKVLVLPKYIRPTDAVARGVRAYLRKRDTMFPASVKMGFAGAKHF